MSDTTTSPGTTSPRSDARASAACPPRGAVSVVVPTLRERESLERLVPQVVAALESANLVAQVVIVDDDSRDGTDELVRQLRGSHDVELCVRVGRRGLSSAVIEGIALARHPVVVVMDADLSHPPEMVPNLALALLEDRADFVLGSRYVEGGRVEGFTLFRWANSLVSTALALPIARVRDPMSGFFAFRKALVDGVPLDPVGYKIGLEVMARCRPRRILELPIVFRNRILGESKLSFKEQVLYLEHLRRLYLVRWPRLARMLAFGAVGAAGTLVNMLVVAALVELVLGQDRRGVLVAAGVAFVVAGTFNYALNRVVTFHDRVKRSWGRGSVLFLLVCLAGLGVNLLTLDFLLQHAGADHYLLKVAAGILAGYLVNYAGAAVLVFPGRVPGSRPSP